MLDSSAGTRFRESTWRDALALQLRVIAALIRRETRAQFGESRLGYLWALIEPGLHLAGFTILFSLVFVRHNPLGGSITLFLITGLIPYWLYLKISSYLVSAIAANRALLTLAPVKPIDVMISRTILQSVTYLFVAVIFFTGLFLFGEEAAMPADPILVCEAICALVTFGFGIGLINCVISAFLPTWSTIFSIVSMPIYFFSGIFFLIDQMPPVFRDFLVYNPLLHLVLWFRSGFYPAYHSPYFDPYYALEWTAIQLVLGLGIFSISRRKLLEPA